jgi:cell division protein FtsL
MSWLFYLKYSVISIEDRIKITRKKISEEKKNYHVLKAEWKSLTAPERIQKLAVKYLNMKQTKPSQLKEFDYSIFHSETSKSKQTKKLSKLLEENLFKKINEDNE